MAQMTDPSSALELFQQYLLAEDVPLEPGKFDPQLFAYVDYPHEMMRISYVKLENRTVTAFVEFVQADFIEAVPCFQIGYAVPTRYRRQGRAKDAVAAALKELEYGLTRNGVATFYVEAIIGIDNAASQRLAAQTLSVAPASITDDVSGLPALHYIRKFGA